MNEQPVSNPFDEHDRNTGMNPLPDADTSGRPLVWLLLGIIAIGCGLLFAVAFLYFKPEATTLLGRYFPSPTATATRTPTSTPTMTPSPTATPTRTPNRTATQRVLGFTATAESYLATASSAAEQWEPAFSETFDNNRAGWIQTTTDDKQYRSISYRISEGKYIWDVTAYQPVISWVRTDDKEYQDFYLSVDIQQSEGPKDADYGIVFREDADGNLYYFGINENSQYFLYLNKDGSWETLISPSLSPSIRKGEVNNIQIFAEAGHFVFFINGRFTAETTSDVLPSGEISLAIELANENDHAVFEFDDLEIRAP